MSDERNVIRVTAETQAKLDDIVERWGNLSRRPTPGWVFEYSQLTASILMGVWAAAALLQLASGNWSDAIVDAWAVWAVASMRWYTKNRTGR